MVACMLQVHVPSPHARGGLHPAFEDVRCVQERGIQVRVGQGVMVAMVPVYGWLVGHGMSMVVVCIWLG